MKKGFLVLENGRCFVGDWRGGQDRAGEVVFNTSHSGYEEMATDPSYFSQIIVTTAPMQGNYGVCSKVWESKNIWINGFISLEIQESRRDKSWLARLDDHNIPIVSGVNTREIVFELRSQGTTWGALVQASTQDEALKIGQKLIAEKKSEDTDWVYQVTRKEAVELEGAVSGGARIAVLDFGCKENILRELQARSGKVKVFPSRISSKGVLDWNPDGIMLSNGPGNPADVKSATETVRGLIGKKFIFGICMGHQILCQAIDAKTYKLKFGHRGSNHPIRDSVLNKIYMTSQNHGYAVNIDTLPSHVEVTHMNLNDNTVSGVRSVKDKFFSVQFHPESCPGPNDSRNLFDFFIEQVQ